MTKEEIFIWAQDKEREYTVLAKLREEVINGTVFLFLPGERGIYKGVYLCLYENSINKPCFTTRIFGGCWIEEREI